jgi:biotin carboxyl carrier protein
LERKVCQRKPSRGGRRVAGRPAERANVIEEPLRPPQDATTAVRRRAAWELYNERQPVQAVGWRGDVRAHWLEPRWSTVQSVDDWSAEQSPPVALPQNPLRVLVKHFASAETAAEAAAAAAVNTTAAAIEAALHPAKTDTPTTAASHSSESPPPLQEEIVLQPFTGTVVSPPFARPELYLNAGGAVWCMDVCAGPQGQQLLAVGIEVRAAFSMKQMFGQSECYHNLVVG